MARRLAFVRGAALPLADRAPAHQHRHGDANRCSVNSSRSACAAVALIMFALTRERSGERGIGARWASRRDLEVLREQHGPGSPPASRPAGRLALGYHRGRLLRAEQRHALVAFGPPQSGKSAGLAIPALLEWQGPAVASSIKTDLLAATLARRRRLGRGARVRPVRTQRSPQGTPGLRCAAPPPGTARWRSRGGSPRQESSTSAESRAATSGRSPPSSVWRRCCTSAARSGGGIEQVVAWAYGQGTRALEAALDGF